MASKQRRIIYYGWLGNYNLGDEALYKAISRIFSPYKYQFITIPADTYYGFNREYSPVTIVGGSTGIPDWMETLRPTRYNYIFGAGVKDPSFYGYNYLFNQKLKASVWISRLKVFRYIGVRGEISKNTLAGWGISSTVIGDPAFSLNPDGSIKRNENKIAVNIGSDGILWGMDDQRVFREIAKTVRSLKKKDYEIVLIPFNKKNVSYVRKLAIEEDANFFNDWFNIESTLNLISSCKILIGERVHSLGLSAATKTPFVGLEYQPPCYEIAQSVGFKNYVIRTDSVSEEKVMKLFNNLLENYDEMQKKLITNVEMYRKRQKEFAAIIAEDIETLPEHYWKASQIRRTVNNLFWKADLIFQRTPILWHAWDSLFFSNTMHYAQ